MNITGMSLASAGQVIVQETAMKTAGMFFDESKAGIVEVYAELRGANSTLLEGMGGNVRTNIEKAINTTENKVENVCKTIEALAAELLVHAVTSVLVDTDANESARGC